MSERKFSFDNTDGLMDSLRGLVELRWPFEVTSDDNAERFTLTFPAPQEEPNHE